MIVLKKFRFFPKVSSYTLEVVSIRDEEDIFARFSYDDEELDGSSRESKRHKKRRESNQRREEYYDEEYDEGPFTLSGLLWDIIRGILHILLEILL